MVNLKRAYDAPSEQDGMRILVDRVWPRGMSKEKIKIDLWLKDVAPSKDLRQWFGHDPAKWAEFQKRYKQELDGNTAYAQLKDITQKEKVVTLIFGAADTEHNQAVALKNLLED